MTELDDPVDGFLLSFLVSFRLDPLPPFLLQGHYCKFEDLGWYKRRPVIRTMKNNVLGHLPRSTGGEGYTKEEKNEFHQTPSKGNRRSCLSKHLIYRGVDVELPTYPLRVLFIPTLTPLILKSPSSLYICRIPLYKIHFINIFY